MTSKKIAAPNAGRWVNHVSGRWSIDFLRRVRPVVKLWGPRAGWSLADQGLMSGANLLLNVLLARWLAPADYGAFAVAYTVFLFLSGFHNALVLEPMSVLQPAQQEADLPAYLGRVVWVHLALTVGLSLLIGVSGLLLAATVPLRNALWGFALSIPIILLFWLFRRAHYVRTRPGDAAASSFVYAVLLTAGTIATWKAGWLSAQSAALLMGAASFVASVYSWCKLRFGKGTLLDELRSGKIVSLGQDHWRYGKWVAVAAILSLAVVQMQTFAVAAILGLEAAGILRAMQTFTFPVAQAIVAIGYLGLPVLSGESLPGSMAGLRRKGTVITASLVAFALAYELVLTAFGGTFEGLLYAHRYREWIWLIPLVGVWPVFSAMASGFSLILRALQRSELYAYVGIATIPIGVVSAVAFTNSWGIGGAAGSMVLSEAAAAVMTIYLYRKWTTRNSSAAGDLAS